MGAKCKGGEEEQEQNRVVFTKTAKVPKKIKSLYPSHLFYNCCSFRSVSDLSNDAETQSEAKGEQKSPKHSLQMTTKSDEVDIVDLEETNDNQANQHNDHSKQRVANEEETTEELGKEKLFLVTKISEEKNCDSAEKSPSNSSIEVDMEDTMEETQSLLGKTEKPEREKKKKGVTLNVAPLATGEVDSESMPATPRTEVSTINSKEQVPLLEWEPKEEEVKSLLRNRKVERVHVVEYFLREFSLLLEKEGE